MITGLSSFLGNEIVPFHSAVIALNTITGSYAHKIPLLSKRFLFRHVVVKPLWSSRDINTLYHQRVCVSRQADELSKQFHVKGSR